MQPTKQWSMPMQHDPFVDWPESRVKRLERVADLLTHEVNDAIEASQGPSWPTMHLKQLKQRVEELHAILKL